MRSGPKTAWPEYRSWKAMKARCQNPKAVDFKYYGGRGILVCDRWQSFDAFFEDMGERRSNTSLDRIDPERGYEPSNCRWALKKTQARNRRNVSKITFDGRTMSAAQWERELGLVRNSILSGIKRGRIAAEIIKNGMHDRRNVVPVQDREASAQ